MDNGGKFCNTSLLSQSYIEGVKRVAGSGDRNEEEFLISQEVIDSREKTWKWLFEKFSEVSDDVELNLRTLKPDTESGGSHDSEYRVPVRKSVAQLQYWIDTGNPPCHHLDQVEVEETDGTISISESEASELQSPSPTSMVVNKKLVTSTDRLVDAVSSASSVDTATYIKTNINATKKASSLSVERDPRATNFANLENNRVSRSINVQTAYVLFNRSMESPGNTKILENSSALQKSTSAVSVECDRDGNGRSVENIHGKGDEVDEPLLSEKLKLSDVKETEVTLDSKESGIDSLPVKNTEKSKKRPEEIVSSDYSDQIVLAPKANQPRMRRLYSQNNSFFDIYASTTPAISRKRYLRYSVHPALNSNSTEKIRKRKFRPSLLILPGNLQARKSRLNSINISRVRNKLRRKSLLSKTKDLRNSDTSLRKDDPPTEVTSAIVAEKTDEVRVTPVKTVDTNPERTLPAESAVSPATKRNKTPKISSLDSSASSLSSNSFSEIIDKKKNTPKISSSGSSSRSMSSDDVSKMISEESCGVSRTSLVNSTEKKLLSNTNVQTSQDRKDDCASAMHDYSRGSVFTPGADASPETIETRTKNMLHAKKNLYATDLRSSGSNDSPAASSPSRESRVNNASPILAGHLRKKPGKSVRLSKKLRKTAGDISSKTPVCGRLDPVVILHDFRSLKNCCGQSDREIHEQWIGRKKSAVDERLDEKSSRIKKSKKTSDRKVSTSKKFKLENEAATLRSGKKIPTRRTLDANDSCSSEELLSYLKCDGPTVDYLVLDNDDYRERKLPNGGNVTVTFKTTDREREESMFVLTSSDDENVFAKLLEDSRPRPSKRKDKKTASNSAVKKVSLEDSASFQDSKIGLVKYEIVLSSSENEESIINKHSLHPAETRKSKRKYPKRNEGKDYPDFKSTMYSRRGGEGGEGGRDGCLVESEGLQHRDKKLEKQSSDVNKRLETPKGKQPSDPRGGSLAVQSEVNNGPRSRRKSRVNKVRRKDNSSERVASNDGKTDGLKNKENENYGGIISEQLRTPIDRVPDRLGRRGAGTSTMTTDNGSGKIDSRSAENLTDVKLTRKSEGSLRNKRRKSYRQIITVSAKSGDDEKEPEVEPALSSKYRKKTLAKIGGSKLFIDDDKWRISDDESTNNDDAMIFSSENNAGSYFCVRGEKNEDTRFTISSYKHSVTPNKRGIGVKDKVDNYTKEKSSSREKKSTIIFQTKEYWESDSDDS